MTLRLTETRGSRTWPAFDQASEGPRPMRLAELSQRLAELEREGLLRRRRRVEGPQGPLLRVDGATCLAFCSNDYLGLANHPALVDAARRALDQFGVGANLAEVGITITLNGQPSAISRGPPFASPYP